MPRSGAILKSSNPTGEMQCWCWERPLGPFLETIAIIDYHFLGLIEYNGKVLNTFEIIHSSCRDAVRVLGATLWLLYKWLIFLVFLNYPVCNQKCKRVLDTHMYVSMMQVFIQFCRRQITVRGYEANVSGLLVNPTKQNAKVWSIHLIEHNSKAWSNLEVIQSNRWDAVLISGATLRALPVRCSADVGSDP